MSDARAPILAFESALVGYGDRTVVRDVDLGLEPGEVVGLIGPNGAGKSTLLRAVTGSARLLGGSITLAGTDIERLTARERARRVAVVPQAPPTLFAFSARAFVEMGRHPWLGRFEALSAADEAVVAEAMRRTDTERLATSATDTLSGGDLQRLTVAQALAQQPAVLLLDEPVSHLDLNHRLQVLDLVRELAEDGIACLAVFHDLDLAARYSDRIAVVADGVVLPPAPPREALDAAMVSEVFGVRAVVGIDAVTGSVSVTPILRGEDARVRRAGSVGLISGSGTGAWLMRRLVLDGYRVVCGALNRGDVDHSVAVALGLEHVELPPFGEIDAAAEARVLHKLSACEVCVVCSTPFGRANLGNLTAALDAGRKAILVGDVGAERDFTGGDAARLWSSAIASGAVAVHDDEEALEAVRRELERVSDAEEDL